MFRTVQKSYTKLGFIPEMNYVLLRDNNTRKIELWAQSRGTELQAIKVDGIELEFVREVKVACRVVDNEYNRVHCPDDIGRIYIDQAPRRASTQELR